MKKIIFLLSMSIIVLLSACSTNSEDTKGIEIINYEEMEDILDGKNEYVLIYADDKAKYMHDLTKVSKNKNKVIKVYKPYMSDGKEENPDGRPIFPDAKMKYNSLYKIENGEIVQELEIEYYEGIERQEEIKRILE